jgi:NifB/MoaA-like Fe-S oxidoreductase
VAVVPLGVSRHSKEKAMRAHTTEEARNTVETVKEWQQRFESALGRRLVWASDEYYLMANMAFPEASEYEGFAQHENGVGMVRAFERAFEQSADGTHARELAEAAAKARSGFFAWVEGAPAEGYRAPRTVAVSLAERPRKARQNHSVTIITAAYGKAVLRPLLDRHGFSDVRVLSVRNDFFGGNISVAGLMAGPDIARSLGEESLAGARYLLPDVCLSKGRFIDGSSPEDLPVPVEVVPTDGALLRRALEATR